MIKIHAWIVGGNTHLNISTSVTNAYRNELVNPAELTTYNAKIGLMYVSDYGYAASSNYWTMALYDYNYVSVNNWMYLGATEWTISRNSSSGNGVMNIRSSGYVYNYPTNDDLTATRPAFYLNSNVQYVSGTGTSNNPIRIN